MSTLVSIALIALVSVDCLCGQTISTTNNATQKSSQDITVTTQSIEIGIARKRAANTLSEIRSKTNIIPLSMYPPGYISRLQAEADGTSMPITFMMHNVPVGKRLKPGDKKNMSYLDPVYTMGSPTSEAERNSDENQHTAIITYHFYISKYEVTQNEYNQVMGNNPSHFTSANGYTDDLDRPVENVTWAQAKSYCDTLTSQALATGAIPIGWAYRLPTEAEWEYSARGTALSSHPITLQTNHSMTVCNVIGSNPWGNNNREWSDSFTAVGSGIIRSFTLYITSLGANPSRLQGNIVDDTAMADSRASNGADICHFDTYISTTGFLEINCDNAIDLQKKVMAGDSMRIGMPYTDSGICLGAQSPNHNIPYLISYSQAFDPSSAFSFGSSIRGGEANFNDWYEYDSSIGTIPINPPRSPQAPFLNMTTNVGSYSANSVDLYDMHGNVAEWCNDWYGNYPSGNDAIDYFGPASGSTRIVRGGSWEDHGVTCRSAARMSLNPESASSHVGFRIVLAPIVPEWKTAVTTTPTQKTYGNYPVRETGKNNLILVTHGWSPKELNPFQAPTDVDWLINMTNAITQYATSHSLTDWQVVGYRWLQNSWTWTAPDALYNAKGEGANLGSAIAVQGWNHVHLIGFSAGAAVIAEAAQWIKSVSPSTTVQCTFLDAYDGNDDSGVLNYGSQSDWSDSYFSHDVTGDVTEQPLVNAYNVNVTQLGPKQGVTKFRSQVTGQMEVCTRTIKYHRWSVDFYLNTITGNGVDGDYAGFGFPLSKEAGGWNSGIPSYVPGNGTPGHTELVRVLGTPDPTCVNDIQITAPSWSSLIPDFGSFPTIQSDTGSNQKGYGVLDLTPGSPSWVATVITPTNPINTVSFDAQFSSVTGSEDMLTVLWDEKTIGFVDERVVQSGLQHYSLRFDTAVSNSTHVLSFRLDPYTDFKSSILLTNVVLTQIGLSQPFTLSVTTNMFGGSHVWKLTGEAGFAYGIQASTNLSSGNWTDIAELINTNGVVQFYDSDSTNYPTRFYRAYVPIKQ